MSGTGLVWLTARLRGRVDESDAELAQLRLQEPRKARRSADPSRSRPSGTRSIWRMFGSPAISATNRSIPIANPPCGGAPIASASSRNPNFSCASSSLIPIVRKTSRLDVRAVDPDRARAELPAVPDEVVVLAQRASGIAGDSLLVPGDRRGERVVEERPVACLLVALEEREVDHPVEEILVATRARAHERGGRGRPPSTRATVASSPAAKSTVEPGSVRNASSSASDRNFAIGDRTSSPS